MIDSIETHLAEAFNKYPLPPNASRFAYGTSGFRTIGETLPPPSFRVGFVTALRSVLQGGLAVGLMVTASHNEAHDNGLKIVDVNAGMLDMAWEPLATEAANSKTCEELASVLRVIVRTFSSSQEVKVGAVSRVHLGYDTRPSGRAIVEALKLALALCGSEVIDHGVVTTPMLHAMVYFDNHKAYHPRLTDPANPPCIPDYFNLINDAAEALFKCSAERRKKLNPNAEPAARRKKLVVDCANGVGACAMRRIITDAPFFASLFDIVLVNTDTEDPAVLNKNCGADHVQKSKVPPPAMCAEHMVTPLNDTNCSYYSLDGDADRIVAFAFENAKTNDSDVAVSARLLDGDRLCILFAVLIRQVCADEQIDLASVDLGIIQTAYANGASTKYVSESLGIKKTVCTATGVKYMHPVAEEMDIGIYFEANGHGTVLFSKQITSKSPVINALSRLISQCCGDAICDMFTCELALHYLGWTSKTWLTMYDDLPSLQTKVKLPDPSVITNTPNQRIALTPVGLQARIDELVAATGDSNARCFVRPSGTEPIVRIYVEASKEETTQTVTQGVEEALHTFCK